MLYNLASLYFDLFSHQADNIQCTLTPINSTKPTNQTLNLQVREALAIFVCGIHQAVCVRLRLFSPSVFPLLTQMFWLHKQPVCCLLDECAVAGSNRALWLPDLLLVLCCRLIFSSCSVCVSHIVHLPGNSL